jgi:hypothetical protein
MFPLVALLGVWLGIWFYRRAHSVEILSVASSLLTSFMLIRLAVYFLRRVFPPSAWLKRSERVIATVLWLGVALYIVGWLDDLIGLLRDDMAIEVGQYKVSAFKLIVVAFTTAASLLLSLWAAGLIESKLMKAEHFDLSLRVMFTKLIRAIAILVAILIAPGLRTAESGQQLRERLHHPHGPLDSPRRHGDHRQPLRRSGPTARPLHGGAKPGRYRGHHSQ